MKEIVSSEWKTLEEKIEEYLNIWIDAIQKLEDATKMGQQRHI